MSDTNSEALARFRTAQIVESFAAARREPAAPVVEAPCDGCSDEVPITAASDRDIVVHGIATTLGVPTGDGRLIEEGALTWDLELEGVPIIWDRDEGDHSGRVVGRLDVITDNGGTLDVVGRLFHTEDPQAAADVARLEELIAENSVGWSIGTDNEEGTVELREAEVSETREGNTIVRISHDSEMLRVSSARLRHLAIVDTPAFPAARPVLGPPPAMAAAAAMATYPANHFDRWESKDPTPLQVDADGRVWGHAAGDGCFRNGSNVCRKYRPDPDKAMRNFHTGTATLANGAVIRVGSLTCNALHADTHLDVNGQRRHHEDTSTVWAKVVAWNDSRGRLCVAGSVVPGLDAATVARAAGLPISPELWPVPGVSGLTLVAAHSVVSPAWPVLT